VSELKRLRWRCRRGVLELDVLLMRYLDRRYLSADEAEKAQFMRLLSLEDSDLLRYLLGERTPAAEVAQIVALIRALPA